LLIGVVAALIGTLVAAAIGVDNTSGVDWIELILQWFLEGVAPRRMAAVPSGCWPGRRLRRPERCAGPPLSRVPGAGHRHR